MTRLYGFELKKIFQKKAFWATLIIGLIFNVLIVSANLLFDTYEYPDGSKVPAVEFFKKEAVECGKLSGRVIDDAFINEVRGKVIDCALDKKYVTEQDIADIKSGKINESFVAENGAGYTTPMIGLDDAAEQLGISNAWYFMMDVMDDNAKLLTTDGESFQKAFRENVEIPKKNKAYWRAEADKRPIPVAYIYDHPLLFLLDSGFFFDWFIFILIAVSLSGSFADERSTRMDALIQSAKRGKSPVAVAKLLAGFTVSIISTILVYTITILTCRIDYGKINMDAPLQMLFADSPHSMTMGDAIIKQFICTLVMSLLFTAVTIFLSQIMSSTAAMGIQTGILMASFLNVPLKNPLLQNLWNLRPTHYMNGWLDNFSIFNIGSLELNSIQMANILYAIGAIIFSVIAIILYKSCQVKSR